MKYSADHRIIASLMVFLLLGTFAVFCTLLIMLGAQAYQGVMDASNGNTNGRILLNYPLNKVRMNDNASNLCIEDQSGVPVLVITQDLDGDAYETRIYCYDGWLREVFSDASDDFYLEDGEALAEASFFNPKLENGLFSFEVAAPQGETLRAHWLLRSQA